MRRKRRGNGCRQMTLRLRLCESYGKHHASPYHYTVVEHVLVRDCVCVGILLDVYQRVLVVLSVAKLAWGAVLRLVVIVRPFIDVNR